MPPQPKPVFLTKTQPDFYLTIGPYLADHAVHKTLGGVPWDDPTKTWIVLKTPEGDLRGFCAVNELGGRGRRTLLESLYTLPGHDDAVPELVQIAVKKFGHDRDLRATIRHALVPHYEKAGFQVLKTTVNMAEVIRPASIRD
ncbi:hypothetical protein ACIQGT_25645 [Streptomyces sp. NPDC093108]|uniref:hypothetical protein n=1 Tax=Streptomyces sp. NPDC093108 TaxID=3366030 RepID=UPI003810DD18